MNFEFDRYIDGKPYPNLARWKAKPFTAEWRKFSLHWPFSEPPSLIDYIKDEDVPMMPGAPNIYLVAVSFFDFSIDWLSLLHPTRVEALRRGDMSLAIFYSEGDNPWVLREHLERSFKAWDVSPRQLLLISANSAADNIPNSFWFADDELLFRHRNRHVPAVLYHEQPRSRLFTALVRTHKWWRATVMADFYRRGWHELGYFSYNPLVNVGEDMTANPIEIDRYAGLRSAVESFVQERYAADDLDSDQHNDHHISVPEHFNDAYLNVVLETHMDVDQSGGVFLTEKTFKPIKNSQPFVIFGAQHSLARLRDLGYRTFDGIIDDSYDAIANTSDRFERIMEVLADMFRGGVSNMHSIYVACRQDLEHNQQHFLSSKRDRLNRLLERLTCV